MTEGKIINWDATNEEWELVEKIADRAEKIYTSAGVRCNKGNLSMDIIATHMNGCRLDLQKLLDFRDFDFVHDISGITNCLNRETAELENCFLPRCAQPDTEELS